MYPTDDDASPIPHCPGTVFFPRPIVNRTPIPLAGKSTLQHMNSTIFRKVRKFRVRVGVRVTQG